MPRKLASALEIWQTEQIKSAMEYAKQNSVFYSEGLTSTDAIPFTTPEDIVKSPKSFLCVAEKDIARVVSLKTSGTTDRPKRIFFTEEDIARTVKFFSKGMQPIVGDGRNVLITMSDGTQNGIADLLQRGLKASGIPSKIHGHIFNVESAAHEATGYDCIVGVPAEIYYLCRTYPMLRPKSVLLSSDYVAKSVIDAIRNTWRCRVFSHYGMTEACYGCAVQSSEDSPHHIRNEEMFIEIIDPQTGKRLKEGERGEIVITFFANRGMPLFRYRTGDISSLVYVSDGEGEVRPALSKIEGRINNLICLKAGGTICIEHLDEIIYRYPEIRAYRAELKERGGEGSKLLIKADCAFDGVLKQICEETASVFGGIDVTAERAFLPPSTGARKRKIIIL